MWQWIVLRRYSEQVHKIVFRSIQRLVIFFINNFFGDFFCQLFNTMHTILWIIDIILYMQHITDSTTHSDQMLYIEAFSNMKIKNILDFLQPIITDQSRSRHIRLAAIWAAKSATTSHPDKVIN